MSGILSKDHRMNTRTNMVCPVYIHGITAGGKKIKTHSVTGNLSESGLFMPMPYCLKIGSIVFTITKLFNGAKIAARGTVVRVENKSPNLFGLAVCFNQSRLIPVI
ncbi:MAG: PilZ domain-containing protein [Gammaproteobacteria bacterium]|nr:PilZ domain-containing protein [Gammaproteobacteria bacterium]